MKEEEKLKGWLSNSLPENELKAFEESSAFGAFDKISETAKQYKAPAYDVDTGLAEIVDNRTSTSHQTAVFPLYRVLRNIAAILVLGIGVFYLFKNNSSDLAINTEDVQKQITLPDASRVILNANSNLSYNEGTWEDNRDIKLSGEAFFKVAKGEKFKVNTEQGTVTVLGTQFTVKDTKDSFEVMCYEGAVSVAVNNENYKLLGGNGVKLTNGTIEKTTSLAVSPSWISTTSIFKSERLAEVVSQLETAYTITVKPTNVDLNVLYTGSFTHRNLSEALQSIAIPLGLTYEIKGTTVILKK